MTRGPIYDNALRLLTTTDLVAVCRWLGIAADPESLRLSEALPAATLHADLITQVGPHHLAHVEFVRSAKPDLANRMLEYRARIMKREPSQTVTQHIVVLAEGTVARQLTDGEQLTMDINVIYVREQDPTSFLSDPALAPLAVLARVDGRCTRQTLLRDALAVIAAVPDPHHRHDLTQTAAVLAGIHLDAVTIETITQEADMPISLEGTIAGRSIAATAEARGAAETLAALLRRTFGDDPRIDDVAGRLARLPREQALDAALTATTLSDLTTFTSTDADARHE
jgi:hypothetical protein